jgi:sulfatase maturation enzyme AslB (radical SAM superfamily)
MESQKNKSVKILAGYSCNNNCIFCGDKSSKRIKDRTTEKIKKELRAAKKGEREDVYFMGGEFTIRKDAIELISYAKYLNFKNIGMTSNGRMFSYSGFAKKVVDSGLTNIIFSINGYNEKTHDAMSGAKGSFKQLIEGINNLKKYGFDKIATNTIVTKQSYRYLPKIGSMLADLGIGQASLIYVSAKSNFFKYTPKVIDAVRHIHGFLDQAKKIDGHKWSVLNMPLFCYSRDYLKYFGETKEETQDQYLNELEYNEDISYRKAESFKMIERYKSKKCKKCKIKNHCLGIWEDYSSHYGEDEIRPII